MANLFKVTVTQINGSALKTSQLFAFYSSSVLITENAQYAPNQSYVEFNGTRYYTTSTVAELVGLANEDAVEQIIADIVQIDGNGQKQPLKVGFPISNISIGPATGVATANCAIQYKTSKYYATQTLDNFVSDANVPVVIPFGDPGDAAGPLDGSGKIPASQLPPLDHDVDKAASEAAMLALSVEAPAICIRTDFTPAHVFYLSGDPATDINNWHDTGSFAGVGGNPTAKVGLVAINGASVNYMRDDAAPAIDQAITPTWTGKHVFARVANAANASVAIESTIPQLDITVTNAAADTKRWNFVGSATALSFRTLNDSGSSGSNIWSLSRTGNGVTEQQWFLLNVSLLQLTANYFQSIKPFYVVSGADGNKLWLAKYSSGTGHNNAPTTLGAPSTYLQIGGREYGNNGFGGIGFGYVSVPTDHPCVWIGHEEKNGAGNTSGDFLVAVRNATTNTPPVEALRIAQNKDATFQGNVTVVGTFTAAGVYSVVASDGKNAQTANINSPTLYEVPVSGMYRVSVYVVLSRAATTSSTLPSCSVSYTEATTGVGVQDIVTLTANTNTVGLHVGGSVVISARQSGTIGYITSGYASAGATSMQYSVHIKVEFLG